MADGRDKTATIGMSLNDQRRSSRRILSDDKRRNNSSNITALLLVSRSISKTAGSVVRPLLLPQLCAHSADDERINPALSLFFSFLVFAVSRGQYFRR